MSVARYACCDALRRTAVAGHPTLNAIAFLEVSDLAPGDLAPAERAAYDALAPGRRRALLWQRRLALHFVNPLSAEHLAGLSADTIAIAGGERISGIGVELLATTADAVDLRASAAGDFSRYTLALVRSGSDLRPPRGFDPVLSSVEFSFKVDCDTDFDCRPEHVCAEATAVQAPEIDYLAKDYASFRRLILDRMALLAPGWRERNPADAGIALVELLAYAGDHLSYRQDAVATEAYLATARRRTSIRRHALLVDYAMHEGANARAWLHVEVSADTVLAPSDLAGCTRIPGLGPRLAPGGREHAAALDARPEWFEPVVASLDPDAPPAPIRLFADLNRLTFHTWGDDRCCLPTGATGAALRGHHPDLAPGAVLILIEEKGPLTGDAADADPRRRHAVRLTLVVHTQDGAPLTDPLDGSAITEIAWHAEDALPFAVCVSARTQDGAPVADVSAALGNAVLVDHGLRRSDALGAVGTPVLEFAGAADGGRCEPAARRPVPVRFRPSLPEGPLTWTGTGPRVIPADPARRERVRFDPDAPAQAATAVLLRDVRAEIVLDSTLDGQSTRWSAARDLLSASGHSPLFVVETEGDGTARLRLGDDEHGRRPLSGEAFEARYRVGNGVAGNVGADSIVHAVSPDGRIVAVRNPMPAGGGTEPESNEQVRRRAPQAFRTQERAVTPADYEEVTTRHPTVQRAAATLRWTGSWNTVFLTVDRFDGEALDEGTEAELLRHVDRYRMAGHDLEFDDPRFVSLELELFVCVAPEAFRSDVRRRLLDVLSSRDLPDGSRGRFHPDNFTFGQTIHLSPILAAAHDVPGVASANATAFGRQGIDDRGPLDDGRLVLGRLEVGRLDNDPNFPEHGVLRTTLSGGK